MSRFRFLACLVLALAAGRGLAAAPDLVSAFFQDDAVIDPQVSPDGTRVAFLTPSAGVDALAMLDLRTGKPALLARARADIDLFFWKGDDRIVYSGGADAVICLSLRTGKSNELGRFPISSRLRGDPNHIFAGLTRVNVNTGHKATDGVDMGNADVLGLLSDNRGDASLRVLKRGSGTEIQSRVGRKSRYHSILRWSDDTAAMNLLCMSGDAKSAFVVTFDHTDTGALRLLDLRTGKTGPALFSPKRGQIGDAILTPDGAQLLGVTILNGDKPVHWLEGAMQRIQASVDAALPGRRNAIVSSSQDEMVDVIHSARQGTPGRYLILNRRSHSLSALGPVHPQVVAAMLGRVEPVQIKARDGFVLHATLTLPPGGAVKPGPMVLVVPDPLHGTPGYAGYDPASRFLAVRGYVVLTVYVRGTAGFGRVYEQAGRHEFTTSMPTDLVDAVHWAVAGGYADPKRIAVYGKDASATLALIAATRSPPRFRCVINDGGSPDLVRFVDEQSSFDADGSRRELQVLGAGGALDFVKPTTRVQDAEYASGVPAVSCFSRRDTADWLAPRHGNLSAASPDRAMGQLQAAVLNIYGPWGAKDKDWIEYDLKKAHKPYTTFHELAPADIHTHAEVRLNYYRQIDAFLAQYL